MNDLRGEPKHPRQPTLTPPGTDGTAAEPMPSSGWNKHRHRPSLPEVFGSIAVPQNGAFWRKLLAFIGPGYLVAVGYMDPGNWATDIGAGSAYNYRLLSVILISNFLAIFLQTLSAKLGLVSGRDLAQACRDSYRKPVVIALWVSAEIAISACDLAEVIGAAIALKLLFHLPLLWGVGLTALDVLVVLALQGKGFRWIEALVMTLIGTMMVIFAIEIGYSHPDWFGVFSGFLPRPEVIRDPAMLYLALGILGATVMPHNLYLHSSIVQTRRIGPTEEDTRTSLKFATIDSTVALMLALLVNASILILAAATFHRSGHTEVADIEGAYALLSPLVGASLATPLFAIALLASGQSSTLTGTLAGQIITEGFLQVRLPPWLLRIFSRALAIVPAIIVIAMTGEHGTTRLLIFSQVILSMQLPFAVIPLIQFTSDRQKMGVFVNSPAVKVVGWLIALMIAALNVYLVAVTFLGH